MGTNYYWFEDGDDNANVDMDDWMYDSDKHIGKISGSGGGTTSFMCRNLKHLTKLEKIVAKNPNEKCIITEMSDLLTAEEFSKMIKECISIKEYRSPFS